MSVSAWIHLTLAVATHITVSQVILGLRGNHDT